MCTVLLQKYSRDRESKHDKSRPRYTARSFSVLTTGCFFFLPLPISFAALDTEDGHPANTGRRQLWLLLPAVVRRVRHHATGPVPAAVLCDLPENAILCRHLAGDGNSRARPAAAIPTGKSFPHTHIRQAKHATH